MEVDGIVGISSGACFGCNYISHQIGRAIRYNLRFCKNWHYGTFRSLLMSGNVYDPKFCYETIPNTPDPFDADAFAANPVPFYAVCTDLETGKPRFTGSERAVMSRYPETAEAMIKRNENYNRTPDLIKELERSGELLVIRPEKAPGVKHMEHDPDKLSELYLCGRRTAERSLEDIREFIAGKHTQGKISGLKSYLYCAGIEACKYFNSGDV